MQRCARPKPSGSEMPSRLIVPRSPLGLCSSFAAKRLRAFVMRPCSLQGTMPVRCSCCSHCRCRSQHASARLRTMTPHHVFVRLRTFVGLRTSSHQIFASLRTTPPLYTCHPGAPLLKPLHIFARLRTPLFAHHHTSWPHVSPYLCTPSAVFALQRKVSHNFTRQRKSSHDNVSLRATLHVFLSTSSYVLT